MADLEAHYRKVIQEEYEKRAQKNVRYSKNAFAKFLGMSPAYYSKLMAGKLLISLDIADKLTKKFKLNESERRKTLLSVAEEQRCHALYLIDQKLTDCDPKLEKHNQLPKSRKKKTISS